MKKLYSLGLSSLSAILLCIMIQQSIGADINSVFSDVDDKTGSLQNWIMTSFLPFVCTISAIACLVGVHCRKVRNFR